MIIYEDTNRCGYKTPPLIDDCFIQSTAVAKKRPHTSSNKLSSENCKFLKKIGLTLKKKSC